MSRRTRIVAALVGLLIGVPALALAASFVFGSFGGQTGFADTTASARILSVSGSAGAGGVDCSSATRTGDNSFEVSPVARRVLAQGQPAAVTPGSCDVVVKLQNTGDTAITPGVATSQVPAGWTFTVAPSSRAGSTIPAGGEGVMVVRATATAEATAGGIAGTLTSEVGAPASAG